MDTDILRPRHRDGAYDFRVYASGPKPPVPPGPLRTSVTGPVPDGVRWWSREARAAGDIRELCAKSVPIFVCMWERPRMLIPPYTAFMTLNDC